MEYGVEAEVARQSDDAAGDLWCGRCRRALAAALGRAWPAQQGGR